MTVVDGSETSNRLFAASILPSSPRNQRSVLVRVEGKRELTSSTSRLSACSGGGLIGDDSEGTTGGVR